MRRGAVFLLTDYGLEDELAGVVRAAVLRVAPRALLVDVTHGVPALDVRAGALALARAVPHLGPGVVVAVVDPGVATERRAIAVEVAGLLGESPSAGRDGGPRFFVGPDNGLLGWAIDARGGARAAVTLAHDFARVSTFDGRDVFAPAAARLWLGADLAALGDPFDPAELERLPALRCGVSSRRVDTEVTWIDRFGNAQLAARPEHLVSAGFGEDLVIEVRVGGRVIAARRAGAFAELGAGEIGVLTDANGHLALVSNRSSAGALLTIRSGDEVVLTQKGTVFRAAPRP